MSIEGVLILPASDLFSSIEFNHVGVIEDDQDYIYLSLDLLEDGLWLDGEDIQIPTRGYTLEDIKLDDVKMYFPANVEITTEDLQIEQKLLFQVGTPKSHNMPAYNLSGNPFEILAVNPLTAKNVTQFSTPLEITLVYDATQFSEQQEAMLQVFYYDPEQRDWFPYETVVDTENNLLSIQTEHLTIFDIGVSDWQAYMPPSIKDFEVSGFTGAATYDYPIQAFEGPGGLKPELSLAYSSQVIDQGAALAQASWVGMGWSLDTGYITRGMHGTNYPGKDTATYEYLAQKDDTFLLELGGMSGRLLPITKNGDLYEYVLQNNPATRFFYKRNTETWEMRTGDGLVYLFGIIYDSNGNPLPEKVALARYEPGDGCHEYPTQVWKWGLLEIRDSFGNKIEYKYHLERKGDYDDRVCNNHIDIYPDEINYGNFKVLFNVEQRQDYKASWTGKHSGVLFSKVRLKSIDLLVNSQRVKSYLFTYWADTNLENLIMPNFKWQGEARTSTLASVQEVADRSVSPTQGYKPTKFFYTSSNGDPDFNNLHLMRIENGYGGVISFEYSPYYHELTADDPRGKTYYLVQDSCPAGDCAEVNSQGWVAVQGGSLSRRNATYHTPPNSNRSILMLTPTGSNPAVMHTSFPETFLKAGTKIRFGHEVSLNSDASSAYASFGYHLTNSNDPSTVRSTTINNLQRNTWAFGSGDLFIPSTFNINEIELFFEVSNTTRIGNLSLRPLIVRFAVVNKTITDTVGQTSASWTYQYPESFRMNDNEGPGWYLPKNTEFWGFPKVEITQTDHVTGASFVTTQEYEVSREKKGLLTSQTVRIGSNCYASSHYTYATQTLYNPGQLANANLWGYTDLKVVWNQLLESTDYSYDGLSCTDIDNATTARLGNRSTYTYLDNATANNNRNLNPISLMSDFFDGISWQTQSLQNWTYSPRVSYQTSELTFEFNNLLKNQYLSHPTQGELQQTFYAYNTPNPSLAKQQEWVDGSGSGKQYAVTAYTWDAKGRLASKQSWQTPVPLNSQPTGMNLKSSYLYENQNFPILVTKETLTGSDGLSFTTLTSYNQLGLPVMVTHPDGSTESAAYDGLGRIVGICGRGFSCEPETFTLTAEYHMENATPPYVIIRREELTPIKFSYNGFGQLTEKKLLGALIANQTQDWTEQRLTYSGLGQTLTETNAGLTRKTTYDDLGRVVSISRVDGTTTVQETSFAYQLVDVGSGKRNWQKTTTDANGNASREYSNALGLTVKLEPPVNTGPSVTYNYDTLGRLTSTNYGGAVSVITYNAAGRKVSMQDPDMGNWQYFYNADGSLRAQIDATQNKTCLVYDSLGRLISKSFGEDNIYCDTLNQNPTITYTYDESGQKGYRTSMSDLSGSTRWVYDSRGRLRQEKKTVLNEEFTTVWNYNNGDQITSMIYPSGERVTYSYLPQGTLESVGNYQTGTVVDAQNRVVEVRFANGMMTNYTYNDWVNGAGRLFSIQSQNQNTSETYQNQTYNYDPVGNITGINDALNGDQTQSFTYDALNRLTSASTIELGEGQYSQSYTYDPSTGNLNYRSDVGNYVYDSYNPHAVTNAGGNIYVYGRNGNMTARVISDMLWEYTYDAENRLVQIDRDGLMVNRYIYDGDGNRVARLDEDNDGTIFVGNYYEATYYSNTIPDPPPPVVEGGNDLNAVVPSGISYYYAGSQRIAMKNNGVVSYLYGDQLGSVSAVARTDGSLLGKTWYHPWGTIRYSQGTTPTDYAYTGQMKESDIYFYNARWYDPAIGRFMQADTIVPLQVQGTQAFDRYAYVNNNPLKYIDSNGHWACDTNGDCFIDGWNKDYTQRQKGNTCAVVSQAVGLSVLSGDVVNQNDIQVIWPLTYIGIGVPVNLQVSGVNTNFRNIEATPMNGDREAIISHLLLDEPVVFTVALPRGMVGHSAIAIGFNSELNQLIIHDSGFGKVMYEDEWVSGWQGQIEMKFPNSDRYKSYSNFDDFQRSFNLFIQPYSFVVLRMAQWSGVSPIQIPFHGGGGNRLFSPFLEAR